jgi:hypothetical protein
MIRVSSLLVSLAILPGALGAQQAWAGLQAGRNAAQLSGGRTRSEPEVGAFAEVDLLEHVGVGWDLTWLRSAVDHGLESSAGSHPIEPEYVLTDLVGRLSWSRSCTAPFEVTFGAAVSGGGWLGARTGGNVVASTPGRADFGHVWGVSFFALDGPVRLRVGVHAFHGERGVWEGGPEQRGSVAFVGLALRIH